MFSPILRNTNFNFKFKGLPSVFYILNLNSNIPTFWCILTLIENFYLVENKTKRKQIKFGGKIVRFVFRKISENML